MDVILAVGVALAGTAGASALLVEPGANTVGFGDTPLFVGSPFMAGNAALRLAPEPFGHVNNATFGDCSVDPETDIAWKVKA